MILRPVNWIASFALVLAACGGAGGGAPPSPSPSSKGEHSSSMALTTDGRTLFVANPDADSVSVVDTRTRTLKVEIALGTAPPAPDADGAFAPGVMPRSVALSRDGATLFVTGERSNRVYFVDVASNRVKRTVHVGSEPIGVVVSGDGKSVYVACSEDATVVRVDVATARVAMTATVPNEPWALGWSGDGSELLVTHFMGPGVTRIEPGTLRVVSTLTIPDLAPRGDRRLAHGQPRGLYDVVARPSTDEVWAIHALLGTDTAQPDLDFQSTAFPALSLLRDGKYERTLSTDSADIPGTDGAIADVVSGPRALAFTSDGDFALMVDGNSEDVVVLDARQRIESSLVRPLPGNMPEGIVVSADDAVAYVDERGSGDVAVLRLDRSGGALTASVDGTAIPRLSADPMPKTLRLGQTLFNSANSSKYPITTDHWIACSTCHMEGRSDAVTWLFAQGPRDTPTNAGGMLGTGFLFRTADRTKVQDYWHTVNVEQGGRFDPVAESQLLDAIADYVNHALPLPVPPTTDPTLVARGEQVFKDSGCADCHAGPRFTDSGTGNPMLDLTGSILLHDIGTCVTAGSFPDVAHDDVDGHSREACAFDTPSLNGVASTPPYLHDGSALTLHDAVIRMPHPPTSADDLDAIVEYLRSL